MASALTAPRLVGQRVLVTGATGFLGRHLLPALVDEGADVLALHGRAAAPAAPVAPTVTWHQGDLRCADQIEKVVRASLADVVIHLAAYGASPDQRDAGLMTAVNVDGTRALWSALPPRTRFVMTGTCAEYGHLSGPALETMSCRPVSPYASAKHAAVRFVVEAARRTGRHALILRPYGPYGPADHPSRVIPTAIIGMLRGEEVPVTEGLQRRDFSYVSDHVEALVRAAACDGLTPGAIYNIGSGHAMTLRDALERVAAVVGGPGRLAFGARPYRDDETWEMVPDVTAAARDLRFQAHVSFDDGVRRTVDWYRNLLTPTRA